MDWSLGESYMRYINGLLRVQSAMLKILIHMFMETTFLFLAPAINVGTRELIMNETRLIDVCCRYDDYDNDTNDMINI